MENQELTFGQKFIGVNFNPSNNPKVDRLKELFAEAVDIVNAENYVGDSELKRAMYNNILGQILNAQMNSVKFIVTDFDKF